MPNRILKESICTSDSIDSLSWFEEVLFYRLIVSCDDFGRFDGRAAIIKNRLFPLKENLTIKAVSAAINTLANNGLVVLYEFEGKPYLCLPTWNEHQNVRAKKSKYPSPDEGKITSESICKQTKSDASKCYRNPIQSESNPNPNPNANICAEQQSGSAPVILLPLNDGTDFSVTKEQADEWGKLYPAVDVMQQLREMKAWLDSNPERKKTARGIKSFCTRWLGKEQDRGGNRGAQKNTAPVLPQVNAGENLARMRAYAERMKREE